MRVTSDILYIGVNDHSVDLFEGQYPVPNGMAYNSYLIRDDKIAVLDTVDRHFVDVWGKNLSDALCGRVPDYLIVQHMEPDHSAGIVAFMERYPDAVILATDRAFLMMRQFFGCDFADRRRVVKEGDTLALGTHTLSFVQAPMVHWPEVMMTYDAHDRVFFSADAFGKFGALDAEEDWACEARRYYFGIVGKYGAQVKNLLKKASALEIATICPLHGPVLSGDLSPYLNLYDTWASYRPESRGVTIAYTSVYGHTEQAVKRLAQCLEEAGVKVALHDLARCDMAEAVEDAFRYDRLVLATTTYNAGIFPFMQTFLAHLTERGYTNRTVALIENGSWAPTAAKEMRRLLEGCRDLTIAEPVVTLRSALSPESEGALASLAKALADAENG